jgi:spore germination protein
MQKKPQGLSNYQVTVTVALSAVGLTVLGLPSTAAKLAGIDGALSVLLAGIFSIAVAGIIAVLGKRFPNQTVIEFSQEILGKFLGRLYGAAVAFYFLCATALVLRGFGDAMKILLLQKTPLELIMISMLLLCLYCIHGGINTIVRINEIFLAPVLGVIGMIILFNVKDVDFFKFRASLSNGLKPVLMGTAGTAMAYLGYEILFFLTPFSRDKKRLILFGTAGLVLPLLVYTSLTFLSIGIVGAESTADLNYPTIHLARRIVFLGTYIERLDIFFIIFWILAVFTTIIAYLYMASISVTRLAGLRNYKPFAFLLLPFAYITAILPQNSVQINMFATAINYMGILVASSSIPLLLLAILRKKGGRSNG